MNERAIDGLARALGRSGSLTRRGALAAAVAAIAGPAAVDAAVSRARKGRSRRNKLRDKPCSFGCDVGFACVLGQCACASEVTCKGVCCAIGERCVDGACAAG